PISNCTFPPKQSHLLRPPPSFPTRRSSDLPTPPYMRVRIRRFRDLSRGRPEVRVAFRRWKLRRSQVPFGLHPIRPWQAPPKRISSEEHTTELQSPCKRVCRRLLDVAGLIRP